MSDPLGEASAEPPAVAKAHKRKSAPCDDAPVPQAGAAKRGCAGSDGGAACVPDDDGRVVGGDGGVMAPPAVPMPPTPLKLDLSQSSFHLPDGSLVQYYPCFIRASASTLMAHLKAQAFWKQGIYNMYGKAVPTPRLLWAMRDEDVDISKAYKVTGSSPWTPQVQAVRDAVVATTGHTISYAQLNYYRNGNDYIGPHTDKEVRDGDIIASVSLGAPRRFLFQSIDDSSVKVDMMLEHGSLLIMTQPVAKGKWKHSLPKMKAAGERINITFRPR